jgi:hypothetical protein
MLKNANLICAERQGRFIVYSLAPGVLVPVDGQDTSKETLELGCCRLELPTKGDS